MGLKYSPEFLPGEKQIIYAGVQTDKMDILIADIKGKILVNLTQQLH